MWNRMGHHRASGPYGPKDEWMTSHWVWKIGKERNKSSDKNRSEVTKRMFSGFRALAIHGNVHQTVKLIKFLRVWCWSKGCAEIRQRKTCVRLKEDLMAILCSSVYLTWGVKGPKKYSRERDSIRHHHLLVDHYMLKRRQRRNVQLLFITKDLRIFSSCASLCENHWNKKISSLSLPG